MIRLVKWWVDRKFTITLLSGEGSLSEQQRSETTREEAVNTLLARLIRGYGASTSARAERRSSAGTPDIRVDLRTNDSVLLECKWEGSRTLLEGQLDERLTAFPEALALIGVLYPERLRYIDDVEAALGAGAARAGANIEALSPVVAESVVSAQFREIRRHRIVVEGFNPSRRHHA